MEQGLEAGGTKEGNFRGDDKDVESRPTISASTDNVEDDTSHRSDALHIDTQASEEGALLRHPSEDRLKKATLDALGVADNENDKGDAQHLDRGVSMQSERRERTGGTVDQIRKVFECRSCIDLKKENIKLESDVKRLQSWSSQLQSGAAALQVKVRLLPHLYLHLCNFHSK